MGGAVLLRRRAERPRFISSQQRFPSAFPNDRPRLAIRLPRSTPPPETTSTTNRNRTPAVALRGCSFPMAHRFVRASKYRKSEMAACP